jgi:hypothetical protein
MVGDEQSDQPWHPKEHHPHYDSYAERPPVVRHHEITFFNILRAGSSMKRQSRYPASVTTIGMSRKPIFAAG